ncbi:sulfatase family protein [Novipirellula aureliae]|nr:sulfatase [Novipirellula aureliae]
MRKFIATVLLGTCCLVAELAIAAPPSEHPNIIYLMADDQNLDSVGCYGNPEMVTPNMDALGRDGLIFDRHYNTTAICMASRATVFTGMYEYKTGTNFSHGNMRPEVWAKSYPVLLRDAGYLTAFAGKFGFVVEGRGQNGKPGMCESDFDIWGGAPGQSSYVTKQNRAMAKYAEEYPHSTLSYGAFGKDVIREGVKQKKPFCLSISFKAPHKPATPDPRFDDVYAGITFTKPANFGRENGEHLAPQSRTGREYKQFVDWHYDTNYNGEMRKYYQQIYAIDVAIGMIRDELKEQGIADNTVIIYTSDNGYFAGAHGLASKELSYEESSHGPLIIFDPRSPTAGKQLRSPALTGNIDFAPTILELAGLPIPDNMDGVSLLPLLNDPAADVREQMAFMNVFGNGANTALTVLTKDLKYTYWWYGDSTMQPTEELFHLTKDPMEMTNMATNPEAAPILEAMRKKYDAELDSWKQEAVPYNNYQQFAELFDRTVPWDQKGARKQRNNRTNNEE